jgi:hypothetical protein
MGRLQQQFHYLTTKGAVIDLSDTRPTRIEATRFCFSAFRRAAWTTALQRLD